MLRPHLRKVVFRFIPFLSREFNLVRNLEIKMARVGESDDIDSRLKTLLDSLSVPRDCDQLRGLTQGSEETPFYCLVERSSLVTGFEIRIERLYEPQLDSEDVHLTLVVTVRPTKITEDNLVVCVRMVVMTGGVLYQGE